MFQPQKNLTYLMPAHFGGGEFDPERKLTQKSTCLAISYETDQELLENFIPEGFELLAPQVDIAFNKLTEINWMHGGQYNLINVVAPVRFHGKNDTIDGLIFTCSLGKQDHTHTRRTGTNRNSENFCRY